MLFMETEGPQFVRRHWSFIVAYILVTSLIIGFLITATFFVYWFIRHTSRPINIHDTLHFSLFMMGAISVVVFIGQLIGGPLTFTGDVVCQLCHRQQKLDRIPFFGGKYYKQPKCECGGDLEPACFWKLKP